MSAAAWSEAARKHYIVMPQVDVNISIIGRFFASA